MTHGTAVHKISENLSSSPVNPRRLTAPITGYRIGNLHGEHPVFSAEGARRHGGRWHSAGARVIYASQHYSTAMLEKLVYFNGDLPPNQHIVAINVPNGVSYEVVNADQLPNWWQQNCEAARRYGQQWYNDKRSAVLLMPSVVARVEHNMLINALHPDFQKITAGPETPVWWDKILFSE